MFDIKVYASSYMEFCHGDLINKLTRCTNLCSSAMLYIVQLHFAVIDL